MDGVDAFYAAYAHGHVTTPPTEFVDLILVPSILHTPTALFREQPWPLQERTRRWLMRHIAAGWAGNTGLVRQDAKLQDRD